jgi:hypothetical protein
MASAMAGHDNAYAAEAVAAESRPEEIPENVLITGSLIRGTVAVGVPVINLGPQDFAKVGAINTSDLFRNIPAFNVKVGGGAGTLGAGRAGGGSRVNLRQGVERRDLDWSPKLLPDHEVATRIYVGL